ncbi:MAG: FtsH protease activity modulator HflK [Thioclava marina]|jgi:protease FtsH subunit HflK|uniref:Protein HflK n=1 Tax=Thioclava marina TaxID=1915077 RepID=A0ABX3MIF9_9RHOB|nr:MULTISPECIES: FtsH protease activity modulator HflK [Thioclava]TNE89342.1 MAG: FtsH protease activity modulator HflK [Paracoccaceae bacterium]MBC7146947.1 FtsH protease activity modulator HflK [Thioclava marina]MBD3804339.1 FtsH protease activity modulator HflK [Thioclava sp.]OOY11197.1 HflK protein [Thioclava marina]OOY26503.1 HflK protein [Thioclava sp. L04-15]
MSNGGPWGGGGGGDDRNDDREDKRPGQRRPGEGGQIPEIEEFMRKGSEQLKVLMGGKGGGSRPGRPAGGGSGGPFPTKIAVVVGLVAVVAIWLGSSLYKVNPEERSVELMFGRYYATKGPGLNLAPWPFITYTKVPVTREQTVDIGSGRAGTNDTGLMLTGDQNIVDLEFQVVWNINDPAKYLFNLTDPQDTIRAVSESAMRDIIARSNLAPILSTARGEIAADLREAVQNTLDSYDAGINIVRVNFNRADPPREVIDSFREVQAAQQERDRLEKEADAYANKVTAGARGEAAQLKEEAEGYRAKIVNAAEGDAARFTSILAEYEKAPDVTKRRMFYETMGQVLSGVDKVVVDTKPGDGGVVPYLPLDQLRKSTPTTNSNTGGNN